ncbi:MAG: uroporphyrinogen-III C-methyltransferase [Gammaproteobacteria bacterium]|nr:uroporphyrinogen-III C-methyltransferase [Gammaproteobacteria bacterium]
MSDESKSKSESGQSQLVQSAAVKGKSKSVEKKTSKSQDKPEDKSAPKSKPIKKTGGSGLAWLALLLAFGLAGGLYYLWQQHNLSRQAQDTEQAKTVERLSELKADISRLTSALQRSREDQKRAGTERVELEAALQSLRTRIGQDRHDWGIAEVEYLLAIANRRLQLEQDVTTALTALESADTRLIFLADPVFHPVREQVAIELRALRAVRQVDREGLALELSSLASAVDSLALPGAPRRSEKTGTPDEKGEINDWRGFLLAVWRDIKGLVTIRQGADAAMPLLSPEQQYFLRSNLRLQLESARLALLQKSPEVYRSALNDATGWLETYFVSEDAATQSMKKALERLRTEHVVTTLPDITTSMLTLRQLLKKQRQSAKQKKSREGSQ